MDYLGIPQERLEKAGGYWTAREISQQPNIWPLIEGLIVSLDKPDPAIDALWLKEAESRMAAYRSGELDAVDADQVFAALGRQS